MIRFDNHDNIKQHPPSPGTNKSYLFKREPPDGAEVIKPICDSNKPSMIDSIEKPSFVRPENTFKPRYYFLSRQTQKSCAYA